MDATVSVQAGCARFGSGAGGGAHGGGGHANVQKSVHKQRVVASCECTRACQLYGNKVGCTHVQETVPS
jgi:hypothetical protein